MDNLPEKMSNKFFMNNQLIKLLEELAECSTAVAKLLNSELPLKKELRLNVIDEIIDVEFLFAQMRYYFDGFEQAKKKNDEEIERRFFK